MNHAPLKWTRVTKRQPCAACAKSDWCTFALLDDGRVLACCMRLESDRPAKNGGWLHTFGDKTENAPRYTPCPSQDPTREVKINPGAILATWRASSGTDRIHELADKLGVAESALHKLGCVWSAQYQAFGFPMRRGRGLVVGIRLRNLSGDQWAVKGSHAGLFIPDLADFADLATVYVCEGASDCAAMLTIGLPAVGRPSCLGQEQDVSEFVRANGCQRVVIVADHDEPGQRGAAKLQGALPVTSCIVTPPAKDIRAAVGGGLTAQMLLGIVRQTAWQKPFASQPARSAVGETSGRAKDTAVFCNPTGVGRQLASLSSRPAEREPLESQ